MMRQLEGRSVSVEAGQEGRGPGGGEAGLTPAVGVEVGEAAIEQEELVDEPSGALSWMSVLDGWLGWVRSGRARRRGRGWRR